jgi:hypothetical protein
MKDAQQMFRGVVEQLKPMLDSTVTRSTEESLLDSVQVIPEELEFRWRQQRQQAAHMEAKKFIVNVSLPSWRGALHGSGVGTPRSSLGWTIAPFEYDDLKGLLLDGCGSHAGHFAPNMLKQTAR